LLELIDNLPTACKLNEAIANDPEAAAQLAEAPRSADPWSPRVSEFDLTATILREILHAIKGLRQVSIAAAGGKPGEEKPFPAPYTEIDRAIAAAERSWAEAFVGQFGFTADDI